MDRLVLPWPPEQQVDHGRSEQDDENQCGDQRTGGPKTDVTELKTDVTEEIEDRSVVRNADQPIQHGVNPCTAAWGRSCSVRRRHAQSNSPALAGSPQTRDVAGLLIWRQMQPGRSEAKSGTA